MFERGEGVAVFLDYRPVLDRESEHAMDIEHQTVEFVLLLNGIDLFLALDYFTGSACILQPFNIVSLG